MKDAERQEIVDGMKTAADVLTLLAHNNDSVRGQLCVLRNSILRGIDLINEQENAITALMGGYGDSCDIDHGCNS